MCEFFLNSYLIFTLQRPIVPVWGRENQHESFVGNDVYFVSPWNDLEGHGLGQIQGHNYIAKENIFTSFSAALRLENFLCHDFHRSNLIVIWQPFAWNTDKSYRYYASYRPERCTERQTKQHANRQTKHQFGRDYERVCEPIFKPCPFAVF